MRMAFQSLVRGSSLFSLWFLVIDSATLLVATLPLLIRELYLVDLLSLRGSTCEMRLKLVPVLCSGQLLPMLRAVLRRKTSTLLSAAERVLGCSACALGRSQGFAPRGPEGHRLGFCFYGRGLCCSSVCINLFPSAGILVGGCDLSWDERSACGCCNR